MGNCELIYLWVEKYKNIENQEFNLSRNFECNYDKNIKKLTIDKFDNNINVFPKNINLIGIVGENGSGKSNLLDFLIKQDEYLGIFIFKSKNKLVVFNKNIKDENLDNKTSYEIELNPLFFNNYGTSLLLLKSNVDINNYEMSGSLTSRRFYKATEKKDFISDLQKNTVELFNIVSINSKKNIGESFKTDPYSLLALNQHFTYLKDKYQHQILKYYTDLEKFIIVHFKIKNLTYNIKDLGSIFKASPNYKDNYKEDRVLIELSEKFNKEKLNLNRLKLLCLIFCYLEEDNLKKMIFNLNKIKVPFIRIYDLLAIVRKQNSYVDKWYKYINIINSENDFKIIIREYLLFIKEIRREILEFSFTPSLSSGEEKLLYIITNIYDHILYMKTIGTTNFTIIMDEPDTLLHPNWQKNFIYIITTFINTFFKNDIFNIIISSHSPFILSDIPKKNVIFLKKENGNCKNVSDDIEIKETFGTNIHTLLSHGFFMGDGLMGEFAKSKIEEIKKFYELVKKSENVINKSENIKNTIKNIYQGYESNFRNIQNLIGEPFLQTIIKNYLDELEIIFNGKNQFLDNEIKRLQRLKDD